MRVSVAQKQRLAEAVEGRFIERLRRYLEGSHADAVAGVDGPELRARIALGIRSARRYGLSWESSVASYVVTMFEVGPNFDRHPAIRRALLDVTLPGDQKLERARRVLSSSDWYEARCGRDAADWALLARRLS